jgi:hypothetical protein
VPEKRIPRIKVLSIAPLVGEAIKRIHRGESVGALFGAEASFTQEMLLWEHGLEGPDDEAASGGPAGDDDVPLGAPASAGA